MLSLVTLLNLALSTATCPFNHFSSAASLSLPRFITVDWMIEIAELKSLSSRTLHQAVTLFDAYLLSRQVDRSALQLLGVTSILVASRYVHNQWLWILKAQVWI